MVTLRSQAGLKQRSQNTAFTASVAAASICEMVAEPSLVAISCQSVRNLNEFVIENNGRVGVRCTESWRRNLVQLKLMGRGGSQNPTASGMLKKDNEP